MTGQTVLDIAAGLDKAASRSCQLLIGCFVLYVICMILTGVVGYYVGVWING